MEGEKKFNLFPLLPRGRGPWALRWRDVHDSRSRRRALCEEAIISYIGGMSARTIKLRVGAGRTFPDIGAANRAVRGIYLMVSKGKFVKSLNN